MVGSLPPPVAVHLRSTESRLPRRRGKPCHGDCRWPRSRRRRSSCYSVASAAGGLRWRTRRQPPPTCAGKAPSPTTSRVLCRYCNQRCQFPIFAADCLRPDLDPSSR